MLQAGNDYNDEDILNRYAILKKMWLLDAIKCEIQESVSKVEEN